jgi:SAM-dependent methyltransferase
MRLLDVACGQAGLVGKAREWGLEAYGIDQSEVALRDALPRLPASTLVVADGHALPFPCGYFDRVVNIGSLEHYLDPVAGAAEMARVLTDDGLACILLPNAYGLRTNVIHAWRSGKVYDDGQPLQRYGTRRQWQRLLEAGGLRVERVVGYESHGETARGIVGLVGLLRHPSRLMVPLVRWLPIDMAAMHVFVCRKSRTGKGG